MSFRALILIILQLFSGQIVQSQVLPHARAEEAGMSSDRLHLIKPAMKRYIREDKLPGIITVVARKGKIVHLEKCGVMDVGKPMKNDAIFRIASMTKPVTSVAVMMLFEEGRFALDDPVDKYILEFRNLKVFSSQDKDGIHVVDQIRSMTIRELLTHTSGFCYGTGKTPVDSMYRNAWLINGTLKDMIYKLSVIPLLSQPGTTWKYSLSTDVLGYLIEVISGKHLDTFLKERIFIPLKMTDTGFNVPKDKLKRCAAIYGNADGRGIEVRQSPEESTFSRPAKFLSGGGGLFSTADDYMIFLQMLLNGGEYNGVRLLKKETVEAMTRNNIKDEILQSEEWDLPGRGFGLGFAVQMDQSDSTVSIGTYEWSGAFNTFFWIDPAEQMACILMTQFTPFSAYPSLVKEFRELVYQSIVR